MDVIHPVRLWQFGGARCRCQSSNSRRRRESNALTIHWNGLVPMLRATWMTECHAGETGRPGPCQESRGAGLIGASRATCLRNEREASLRIQ